MSKKASARIQKFSSEHLLQQAIAGLLARMPGIRDVQILHGAQEYGKDIVFYSEGPLGEALPCACVVKNKKISGRAGDNAGARTVFEQVEQALDTPFLDGSGEEVRIHRAYVISPEEIAQTTINSIKGKLSNRSGQIVFAGGSKLFELFRTHWLDFLSDEYTAVDSYLKSLPKRICTNELMEVADLYGLGEVEKPETSIYIDRVIYREVPKYNFGSFIDNVIPKNESLDFDWNKQQIQKALNGLEILRISLEHLQKWNYFMKANNNTPTTLSSMVEIILRIDRNLKSEWLKALNRKYRYSYKNLADAPADKTATVSAGDRIRKDLDRLRNVLSEILFPVRVLCRITQRLTNITKKSMDIFSVPEWRFGCALDNCIKAAPRDIFSPRPGLYVEVKESQIQDHFESLLIVGAAGFGKTSLCRWDALRDAENFRTGKGFVFPLYVPLHALNSQELECFEATFLRGLGLSGLLRDSAFGAARVLRLYLDGLDEISSELQRKRVIELVRYGEFGSLKIQLLVTARDYICAEWLNWLPRLHLKGFTGNEVESLKTAWLKNDPEVLADFDKQMAQIPTIRDLMKVPLLATLIILVFRQTKRLPENKSRLYAMFADLLSGGWDLAKGVLRTSYFGRVVKVMVLSDLAAAVHSARTRYFGQEEIDRSVDRFVTKNSGSPASLLRDELLVDGIISSSGERFFFSHFSFQEFLAAKHLLGDPQSQLASLALGEFFEGDDWWREVLRFYLGLSENPTSITSWLLTEFENKKADPKRTIEILSVLRESFADFDLSAYAKHYAPKQWRKLLGEWREVMGAR